MTDASSTLPTLASAAGGHVRPASSNTGGETDTSIGHVVGSDAIGTGTVERKPENKQKRKRTRCVTLCFTLPTYLRLGIQNNTDSAGLFSILSIANT